MASPRSPPPKTGRTQSLCQARTGAASSKKGIKTTREANPTKLTALSDLLSTLKKQENGKEGSPTAPMEIPNTVTQPKTTACEDRNQTNGHSMDEVNSGIQELKIEDEED